MVLLLDDRLLVRPLPGRPDLADPGRHHRLLRRRHGRVVPRRVDGRGVRVAGLGFPHVAVVRARAELGRRTSCGYDPRRSRHERLEQVDRAAVVVGRERGEEKTRRTRDHDDPGMVLLNGVLLTRRYGRDLHIYPRILLSGGGIGDRVDIRIPRTAGLLVHVAVVRRPL